MQTGSKNEQVKHIGMEPISIEKELKKSFLDYALSVIVSRALPDVRDGLKPVHRRILYAMHTLGYYHSKSHRKSATVVGEVIGRYHPHSDSPIYQAMVGLVQDFSKRYPLLDGQGNWGSIDGDNAAAMRYTEVRMHKIAHELLADIEKNTVDFVPNYDESTTEPTLLPSKVPNLLINGSSGIAVGMATFIPPHNLTEVINAASVLLENSSISDAELFDLVPAPDFPTGGIICGRAGVVKAYTTGHGNVIVRGVVDVEEKKGKPVSLVVSEIPYMVNKSDLISKIADLVKEKVIEGISNIRDESNKKGIRLVIELKRGENPQVILNQLYKHTSLQSSVTILLLALYKNRPMIFTLREMIEHFLDHRRRVILRRTKFDLDKNRRREHILQGLIIALDNIDEVIPLIKKAPDAHTALGQLQEKYKLSEEQARAILDMKLQRLTGLERDKIRDEMESIQKTIAWLLTILNDEKVLRSEIGKELDEVKAAYGDERKSRIEGAIDLLSEADLIPDEEVVVTLTRKGYIKRVPLDTYEVQHRGGRGKKGMSGLEESDDVMQDIFVSHNHDELLFFTNYGRVYSLTVFQVPEASRTARGRAIINLIPLTDGEHVVRLLCTRDLKGHYLVMVTRKGTIKKTKAEAFAKIRSTGIRAVSLDEKDALAFCDLSTGEDTVVLATAHGQGIRFKEDEVRAMGRQAAGVRGIRLKENDFVVGMEVVSDGRDLLFATSRGYGKRVRIDDFRIAHRGGLGVRTIPTGGRNGEVIGLVQVSPRSNILLIDMNGKIIRLSPEEVRTMGRQARGVRLIRLDKDQYLTSLVAFEEDEEEENNDDTSSSSSSQKAATKADDSSPEETGEVLQALSSESSAPSTPLSMSTRVDDRDDDDSVGYGHTISAAPRMEDEYSEPTDDSSDEEQRTLF